MEISLILVAKILLMGLLLTILWLQLLRIAVWMMQQVIKWTTSGGEKEKILRLLRRLLLDPL